MSLDLEKALQASENEKQVSDEVIKRCRARAKLMLKALTPKQRAMVLDPSPHISALCPRRAGKTFAGALAALIVGEANPGSISLIISLNLKQLRRLYWAGGASGLHTLARKFGVKLEFNTNALRWEHENGSIGYLLGCEDDEQLEVIRGLEADLYLIDECKSFAPGKLLKLIDDIIDPQRSSREGRVIMIGTPGFIRQGPFFQATCMDARKTIKDENGLDIKVPYLVPYGTKDPWKRDVVEDLLWSFHSWTLEENTAKPHQWRDALRKKKSKSWADDHPTWVREYLGRWTFGGSGLVFRYSTVKMLGKCNWYPTQQPKQPHGLPLEGAPWRFIAGLDFGYEAPTALVIGAYSRKLGQLRVVHEEGHRHMLMDDIASMLDKAEAKFGLIDAIYADAGNLGVTFCEELLKRGYPIVKSKKREKLDYIELLNGGFESGEVMVIEGTRLEEQLLTVAWELGDEDEDEIAELARLGKLVEDDNIPNDFTDALLYMFRGSYHQYRVMQEKAPPKEGSVEWRKKWEKEQLAKARRELAKEATAKAAGRSLTNTAPGFVRRALKEKWTIPTRLPVPARSLLRTLTCFAKSSCSARKAA